MFRVSGQTSRFVLKTAARSSRPSCPSAVRANGASTLSSSSGRKKNMDGIPEDLREKNRKMKQVKESSKPVYDPSKPLRGTNIVSIFPIVQIRNEDGTLSGPMSTLVLNDTLPKKCILDLVSASPPIVRLLTKTEEAKSAAKIERKASKVKQQKQKTSMEQKEIQMTWDASLGDARHKMLRVRETLERGQRAAVVITTKPNTRPPPVNQMNRFLDDLLGMIRDIGEEWQERQFVRGTGVLRLQQIKS